MSDAIIEKCGIFGVHGKHLQAARLTYFGLYALQHRGQESSGIAASNGTKISIHKNLGLVAQVYAEKDFKQLKGHIAIGHNRYATSGGSYPEHNQPVGHTNDIMVMAHNGNLPSTAKLRRYLQVLGVYTNGHNDSELMHMLIKYYLVKKYPLEKAILEALPLFTGAYCLLIMTKDAIAAVRDPFGIRPLSFGRLDDGYVFSSETCALDTINATYERDVNPGELIIIDKHGFHSQQFAPANPKLDIFEFVYFSRPDSLLMGKRVYDVRKKLGMQLAKEHPIKVDVIVPVPDSAIPAAIGYAQALGIPFEYGLVKNRYIGRTFIMPDQHLRDRGVQMKLNPIRDVFVGKRVALVDDSIVRSTTAKKLVKMARSAGAKTVHVLSSCPPVRFPDFYGINTPSQKELIASEKTISQIKTFIDANSLSYLSYEGMIQAIGLPETAFCTSCFTGKYPIDIGKNIKKITGASIIFPETAANGKTERIAVLISNKGGGTNLKAVIDAKKARKIKASIALVVSDKEDAKGLEHARKNHIPWVVKQLSDKTKRDAFGKELAETFNEHHITIAVLAGFMTILPPSYFATFKGMTINIHPGLIPDEKQKPIRFPNGSIAPWNQGIMTEKAVANFLPHKYAGSTVHVVTQEADFGPVLERRIIKTKPNDTVESLYQRLKKEEHKALIHVLQKISNR